ncbi:MAG TPA: hypothetical protein VL091_02295 [Marinobacter sp.]|nr:hypothetical protein [Marinobacter sp.]
MKNFTKIIAVALVMATPIVWAQGSGNQQNPAVTMMSTEQMQQMHKNMSRMQDMAPMMRESSGQSRQKLMQEHMKLMQEQMHLMRGGMMGGRGMMNGQGMMSGQGMMGGQGMHGHSGQGRPGIKTEDRIELIEKRMDQMQLMMEQMLEHQQELQDSAK